MIAVFWGQLRVSTISGFTMPAGEPDDFWATMRAHGRLPYCSRQWDSRHAHSVASSWRASRLRRSSEHLKGMYWSLVTSVSTRVKRPLSPSMVSRIVRRWTVGSKLPSSLINPQDVRQQPSEAGDNTTSPYACRAIVSGEYSGLGRSRIGIGEFAGALNRDLPRFSLASRKYAMIRLAGIIDKRSASSCSGKRGYCNRATSRLNRLPRAAS